MFQFARFFVNYRLNPGVIDRLAPTQGDAVDPKSRHKGKFESEAYLKEIGMPYTSIRPTYIYGPLNYNPLEQYFFERLDQDRTVIVPGKVHSPRVRKGRSTEHRSFCHAPVSNRMSPF